MADQIFNSPVLTGKPVPAHEHRKLVTFLIILVVVAVVIGLVIWLSPSEPEVPNLAPLGDSAQQKEMKMKAALVASIEGRQNEPLSPEELKIKEAQLKMIRR